MIIVWKTVKDTWDVFGSLLGTISGPAPEAPAHIARVTVSDGLVTHLAATDGAVTTIELSEAPITTIEISEYPL